MVTIASADRSEHAAGASVEVRIATRSDNLDLQAYTQILTEVRLALGEVDRLVLPGRAPRVKWAVGDLEKTDDVVVRLVPARIPFLRSSETVIATARGLVDGVEALSRHAEIPQLFGPSTVERVHHIGRRLGQAGIERVHLRSVNGDSRGAVVDEATADNARVAIAPARKTYSSVSGVLDVLHGRDRERPRAQIFDAATRRAVNIQGRAEHGAALHEAWNRRVVAGGTLVRNSVGQPIRLELEELVILPDVVRRMTAWQLLGADPAFTGPLSTAEYLDEVRRG